MERRTFLGGLTAASFGEMRENSFTDPAQAHRDLRRSACLRPQWDTRFRRRSLPSRKRTLTTPQFSSSSSLQLEARIAKGEENA